MIHVINYAKVQEVRFSRVNSSQILDEWVEVC